MGAALSSFGASLKATFKNPVYLAMVAVSAVAYFVLAGVTQFIPIIGQLVFFLVVVPALNAGLIGIAYAINEHGSGPVSSYVDSIKENLVSMSGAYLLSGIIQFVLFVVLSVVMTLVTAIIGAGIISQVSNPEQLAQDPQAVLGLLAAQGLIIFVVFLLWFFLLGLVFMLFQFIGPAIVVGGRSATSAIGKSVGVFTSNPLSVIGYTFLRGLSFTIIVAIPFALITLGGLQGAGTGPNPTPNPNSPLVLVGGLLLLVTLPVAYGFFMMYHTTYYYRVTDGDRQGRQDAPHDSGAPGAAGAPGGQPPQGQAPQGQYQQGQGGQQYQGQGGSQYQQGQGSGQYQQGQSGGQYQQGGQPNQYQGGQQPQGPGGQHQPQGGQGGQRPQGSQQPQRGQSGQQPPGGQGGQQPHGGQGGQQPHGGHGGQQPQGGQGGQPQGSHGGQPQGGQGGQPQGGQSPGGHGSDTSQDHGQTQGDGHTQDTDRAGDDRQEASEEADAGQDTDEESNSSR